MTDKSTFTKDEWALLLESPMIAGMAITAADPSGFAASELSRFATLFRSPPGREFYRVAIADLPVGSGT